MPIIYDRIPSDATRYSLHLMRCGQGATIHGIVTSSNLLGLRTHYYGGRTTPCLETECKPCSLGLSSRWHAYFGVWTSGKSRHVLLELTATPAVALQNYHDIHGTTRGAQIEVKRLGKRQNGRVQCTACPADLSKLKIPPEPEILPALATLWSIPVDAFTYGAPEHDKSTIATIIGRCANLILNPADGNGQGQEQPANSSRDPDGT